MHLPAQATSVPEIASILPRKSEIFRRIALDVLYETCPHLGVRMGRTFGESNMAKKKATTKKAAKKTAATKANGKAKAAVKRVSALDAAHAVLVKAGEAMASKELIAAMADQGLWQSPGGKTPWATLYAAMSREIALKGKDARFRKSERGRFVAA